jgi:hypothetical protein
MSFVSEALEQAYLAGNHHAARRIARRIVQQGDAESAELARARRVLAETTPDLFLAWVGALGLGLVAWLVYNYVL